METTKKNNGGWKAFGITVVVLLLLALVGGLFVGLFSTGKSVVEDPVEENVGEFVVDVDDNDDDNGITVLMAKIDPEEYGDYGLDTYSSLESAYTLSVIYNEGASDPKFEWSITEGDGQTVTITPSDDTLSCVVACSGPFTTVVVVTVTAVNNPSLSASCTCNYVAGVTDFYLKLTIADTDTEVPDTYTFYDFGLWSTYSLTDFTYGCHQFVYLEEKYCYFVYGDGTVSDDVVSFEWDIYSMKKDCIVAYNDGFGYRTATGVGGDFDTYYCGTLYNEDTCTFTLTAHSDIFGDRVFVYEFTIGGGYIDLTSVDLDMSDLLFGVD